MSAEADDALLHPLAEAFESLSAEIGKVIIGQKDVVEQLLIGLLARGHCLLVGVPGLAKTLLVSTVGQALDLSFKRIQFTPDLMPADISGTDILQDDPEGGRRRFVFLPGPVFANLVLADEINRTPPKTQAALLEAMQEGHVTAGGRTYPLPRPFFVLATQNPIEQEGTYPLPEAQLDRFLFQIRVDYPTRDEELAILRATTGASRSAVRPVLTADRVAELQDLVRRVIVSDHLFEYAADLARSTRPAEPKAPAFIREWVAWGAGPRAGQSLILAAKARALLNRRLHVVTDDLKKLARPVLRHRLVTTFQADGDGVTTDQIVDRLLVELPAPVDRVAPSRG